MLSKRITIQNREGKRKERKEVGERERDKRVYVRVLFVWRKKISANICTPPSTKGKV